MDADKEMQMRKWLTLAAAAATLALTACLAALAGKRSLQPAS